MKKGHRFFYGVTILSALIIVCVVAVFYVRQMNRTISDNIIGSISEMAEHDKKTIQTYINICWDDLSEISGRFGSADCRTKSDLEKRMSVECNSSGFRNLYLVAEDGTVYSDENSVHTAVKDADGQQPDFLQLFAEGQEKVFTRVNDMTDGEAGTGKIILYGVRLNDFLADGKKMLALIGISDIASIRDNMVIDSFIKNGKSRGHSALIDKNGNYIIDINKKIYQNESNNLYQHLTESENSELTNEEVSEKLKNSETFGFYHSHAEEKYRELFYFIPFGNGLDLYCLMSVNDEVFMEQSRAFVTMSISMLVIAVIVVIVMLSVVMVYQNKTVRATEKARSQKEFLSNMSHEIRTPLNGLIGLNHLMMIYIDEEEQRNQIKEWLKKSHSTANYLLSLVNDILDMSKLQAGKVDLINEPLLVSQLTDEICAMQADNIKSRGIELLVEKNIIEPCIEADATRIKQILMNIVGNAAKFTPEGGRITLSVWQERTGEEKVATMFRCEDTGIGISREYLGQIFDSFSQERNKYTEGIKGTGLGMAISKLLANAMDGDITVESEPGVGSTFTVTIPSAAVKEIPDYLMEDEAGTGTENTRTKHAEGQKKRRVKILVAEDVDLNAEVLLEILAMEGFETVHARNGEEALRLFEESEIGEIDIILMDMKMPVMDGCSAAKAIRNLDREDASTVTIYACTANTFQEDRELALESGMNDFLSKPIDVNVLLKKINK